MPVNGVRLDEIPNKVTINQPSHGFSLPSYGFIPVRYNNLTGDYVSAVADSIQEVADAVIVDVPDANNFTIQQEGFIEVTGHGLDVGKWYVLRSGLAGLILPWDSLAGNDQLVQYLCFVVDADNILLRIDPAFIEDFFIAQDIAVLDDWTQGAAPALSAGTNRMLLVCVNWEEDTGTLVTDIQVGGVSGTEVVSQPITSGFQYGAAMWRWTDAEIDSMVGNTVAVTWSAGVPLDFQTSTAMYENVDQTTPLIQANSDSGTGATDTLDADVNTLDGGLAVLNSGGGNTGMGFTNNGTGWTRKLDLTITSADGVVDDKLISADATPENVNISITGSNRHVLIAASFRRQE